MELERWLTCKEYLLLLQKPSVPYGSSQPFRPLVPGIPFPGYHRHCLHMVCIHACKQDAHSHKIKATKTFKLLISTEITNIFIIPQHQDLVAPEKYVQK